MYYYGNSSCFSLIWVLSSAYERGYNLPSVKCSINVQDEVKTKQKKTKQNKSAYVLIYYK